jgi:hypothetical protein
MLPTEITGAHRCMGLSGLICHHFMPCPAHQAQLVLVPAKVCDCVALEH